MYVVSASLAIRARFGWPAPRDEEVGRAIGTFDARQTLIMLARARVRRTADVESERIDAHGQRIESCFHVGNETDRGILSGRSA